jgi:putative transposase
MALALDNPLKMLDISSMETTKQSKLDSQRDEYRVYLIVYHLIWCPKPLLVGAVKQRCQALIKAKCKEKGWTILTLAIMSDHIHLFVRVWLSDSAAAVAKELKGVTSFYMRKEFRELTSKLPSLWMRSYFASTAGNVSKETIEWYIAAQKGL